MLQGICNAATLPSGFMLAPPPGATPSKGLAALALDQKEA